MAKTTRSARTATPPARVVTAPPLPMSMGDFYKLSGYQKDQVRQFHGADIEDRLDREFRANLKIKNARAGVSYEPRRG